MDGVEKNLMNLEKEITCAICQEHYEQPKMLPCLHFYCKECIFQLAFRAGNDNPFPCPECRQEASLPEGNVDNLQTAVFINRLKDQYDQLEKALSKEVKCEMCSTSEVKAEAFCKQCNKFACTKCVESHQWLKVIFDGHKIMSLDESIKTEAESILINNPPTECHVHQESFKIFCFDCNQFICPDRTIKDHMGHEFEFCGVAAINKKEELIDSLTPLREMEGRLFSAVEEIKRTRLKLEAQAVSVANNINTSFEELHMILERRKQQLLEEARVGVNDKMVSLEGQEENISIACAKVHSIISNTEQCIKNCSDNEVLCMYAEIGSQIKQEIEEHGQLGGIVIPVELDKVEVEVRCAEALEQLCQIRAKIVVCPYNFVINNKIARKAKVNKVSEVNMSVTITKPDAQVFSDLSSLYDSSLIKCNVKEFETGEYFIQYTPTVCGRHELSVSVDGQPVAGSPFHVQICSPHTRLNKPVKVWDGFKKPYGIAINSVGEIIVAECEGDIVVLDRDGRRLRTINSSEYLFEKLYGVAVDSEDNIYFTDVCTNRIFKANRNCNKVQMHQVHQVQGSGHIHVAVVGDEVMVTECGNKGVIMVYDRELIYMRQIAGVNDNPLRGLCPDSHQNVYVCDYGNSSIQVYRKNGELLRSFGCDENGVKGLIRPFGVCVAGQYVYVTDVGACKIVVFTTEGDYVTSFGGYWSYGVCVDQDGFVYVTDSAHSKINIY